MKVYKIIWALWLILCCVKEKEEPGEDFVDKKDDYYKDIISPEKKEEIKECVNGKCECRFWDKSFGGKYEEEAYSIQQTTDGGFIVAGRTNSWSVGGWDIWVVKLNPDGEMEWENTYGGKEDDWGNSIQQTKDGGYIVAGATKSKGGGGLDFWIVKIDSSGTVQWDTIFGAKYDDEAYCVKETKDGGFIAVGEIDFKVLTTGAVEGGNLFVLKLTPKGNIEWDKTFGKDGEDNGSSIQLTKDGGYIVTGFTSSKGEGFTDFWTLKLNSDGEIEWEQTYGGKFDDQSSSIQQTKDGGYIVAGFTDSKGLGKSDYWIIKVDSAGDVEWDKTFGGNDWDVATSIQQIQDGGYIVAGWSTSVGLGGADFWIINIDSKGKSRWEKTYGGSKDDYPYSIQQTDDGGYVVAGVTASKGEGGLDFWVIKMDKDGDFKCD